MLAAFLEWFLWLAAFIYCLVKVFQKAEHYTIRLLAVVMIILFTCLRYDGYFGNYLALKLTYPEEPSSSRSWLLPSRCPVGSPDTSPYPWLASCNGSPSGLSLPYSLFPGFSVCSSSSPTR